MFEVTNRSPGVRTFQVKAGDPYKDEAGREIQPVRTHMLQPGAAETLDLVNPDHPAVKGMSGVTITAVQVEAPPSNQGGEPLKAVHRGRGTFSIMQGEKELLEGLTKADADTFNAMPEADRAAFVSDRARA